jgi:hypothetical protein
LTPLRASKYHIDGRCNCASRGAWLSPIAFLKLRRGPVSSAQTYSNRKGNAAKIGAGLSQNQQCPTRPARTQRTYAEAGLIPAREIMIPPQSHQDPSASGGISHRDPTGSRGISHRDPGIMMGSRRLSSLEAGIGRKRQLALSDLRHAKGGRNQHRIVPPGSGCGKIFPDNSLLIPWWVQPQPMNMRVNALPALTGKKIPVNFPVLRITGNYQRNRLNALKSYRRSRCVSAVRA